MIEIPTAAKPVITVHGDAMTGLRQLPSELFDAVVTDPPYSSGGFTRGDRQATVATKYVQSGQTKEWDGFGGDNRDTRSWSFWCLLWLAECRRVVKPGGYLLMFTDWRQLPTATDVVQAGEWQWRGVIPWNKTLGARAPHKGYYRHQCEYVVWGTNGPLPVAGLDDERGGPWPGFFTVAVKHSDKYHMTGKPTELLRGLLKCVPAGGLVLDPFAGSGTLGVAAVLEGKRALQIESSREHVRTCRERARRAVVSKGDPDLFGEL